LLSVSNSSFSSCSTGNLAADDRTGEGSISESETTSSSSKERQSKPEIDEQENVLGKAGI
jgi:hypothetical protein